MGPIISALTILGTIVATVIAIRKKPGSVKVATSVFFGNVIFTALVFSLTKSTFSFIGYFINAIGLTYHVTVANSLSVASKGGAGATKQARANPDPAPVALFFVALVISILLILGFVFSGWGCGKHGCSF